MKPTPVLLLCHSLGIGGSERQLAETAKALRGSQFAPHVASFHAGGIRAEELAEAGVPIIEFSVRSFASYSAIRGARALRHYVEREGIGLLHSFDVPLNIFTTFALGIGRDPVVLTSQRGHRSLTGTLYHHLLRLTDQMTDGIVVNCAYIQRHLTIDEKVSSDLIDICYNGIDTDRFSPGERGCRREHMIGTVCALRREKDLPTLLRAFAAVLARRPEARLLIVGSGPEEASLKEQARKLAIAHACTFQPTTPDVVPWLRQMDTFVMPSRSEAFSNAIMEAMACGACVLASEVGGNPELIGHNERGLLFPSGDAGVLATLLVDVIGNHELRQSLANRARIWVESHLSVAASSAGMQEIYRKRLRIQRGF